MLDLDTADHPFAPSLLDSVLCKECGEHTSWHPFSIEQETAWLRDWERIVRVFGWQVVHRNYKDDPVLDDVTEGYGFYIYMLIKREDEIVRTVRLGTLMMVEFAPGESAAQEGLM